MEITRTKLSVVCDNEDCDWEQQIPETGLKLWLNKNCPICDSGPIIDEEDLEIFGMAESIAFDKSIQNIDINNIQPDGTLKIDVAVSSKEVKDVRKAKASKD